MPEYALQPFGKLAACFRRSTPWRRELLARADDKKPQDADAWQFRSSAGCRPPGEGATHIAHAGPPKNTRQDRQE